MEIVLLILVSLAATATLGLLLRGRRKPNVELGTPAPTQPATVEVNDDDAHAELVLAPDEVLVLPPANEYASALAIGRADSLMALEQAGLLTPRAERRPFQQLIDRIGVERRRSERREMRELADEPLEGGYLRLSEKSAQQLARGKPVIARTGEMLGQVNDKETKRRHHLRFTDYKTVADPNLIRSASMLRAMAALQEQMEAVEERLIQVQKTLGTLCKELDYDRLSTILAAKESIQETADDVRRRGRMTQTDMISVNAARDTIRQQLLSAHFNLTDLTQNFGRARSRRERFEALEDVLQTNRLDFWLAMFVEAELAHIRSDILKLLYEASEHPDTSVALERQMREQIAARRSELAAVGTILRDISNPDARRRLDHLQQISRYKLSRHRPIVDGLLDRHGDVFAEPELLLSGSEGSSGADTLDDDPEHKRRIGR